MFTKLIVIINDVCKSNHYALHLKLTQCCISIYLSKKEEKRHTKLRTHQRNMVKLY